MCNLLPKLQRDIGYILLEKLKSFSSQLALALQMSHSDAVSAGVQPNDVNTAIGNLTDSSDSRLEQFPQGFWLLGRDDAASDLAIERPKSVEGKFCGIAANSSDPTSAALLKGRTAFRGLSECRLQQASPQKRGDLNGPSVSSTLFTGSPARSHLVSPEF